MYIYRRVSHHFPTRIYSLRNALRFLHFEVKCLDSQLLFPAISLTLPSDPNGMHLVAMMTVFAIFPSRPPNFDVFYATALSECAQLLRLSADVLQILVDLGAVELLALSALDLLILMLLTHGGILVGVLKWFCMSISSSLCPPLHGAP